MAQGGVPFKSLRDEVQERTKALGQRTQEAESARAALEKADREDIFLSEYFA